MEFMAMSDQHPDKRPDLSWLRNASLPSRSWSAVAARSFSCGAIALVLAIGCGRPFTDIEGPEIDDVQPDLSIVQLSNRITLTLSATSFRGVSRVTANGESMARDESGDRWVGSVGLVRGINPIVVEAFDSDEVASVDTLYALHGTYALTSVGPAIPQPRGGHAATRMTNGTILLSGGAAARGAAALDDAYILPALSPRFRATTQKMNDARTGHTGSLLPDGRILIAGGSLSDDVDDIDDLVETVEIYDPETDVFVPVPVVGDPIRRTNHTASVRNTGRSLLVDFYGGRGDIQYQPTPRLGIRSDIRTFELFGDTLFARSPAPGPRLDDAIDGHEQTPLDGILTFAPREFLISGAYFIEDVVERVGFTLDFGSSLGILRTEAPAPTVPRKGHASVPTAPGLVALIGGRQATETETLNSVEIYSSVANRYFLLEFDDGPQPTARFDHSATILTSNRILLVGGFESDGSGSTASEYFDLLLQ